MTLTQLDYIIAVDTYRHFATAADHCHITQPTLSMQIQKLEDELGVLLFDRSKQPVIPTEIGIVILAQAREVSRAARRIPELIRDLAGDVSGELRLGIIPTLAPYLLPRFIGPFMSQYPAVTVQVEELVTEQIVERLRTGLLDVGLVVTPLNEGGLSERLLFQEPFVVYATDAHPLARTPLVRAETLPVDGLWLLSEGHCFRHQVLNLCRTRPTASSLNESVAGLAGAPEPTHRQARLRYETGSLETLVRLIDQQQGFTLLPYLATLDLDETHCARLHPFYDPQPVREVSLVMHRSYLKRKLIDALHPCILDYLPTELKTGTGRVVPWR